MRKRMVALFVTLTLVTTLLAGCGSKKTEQTDSPAPTVSTTEEDVSDSTTPEANASTAPKSITVANTADLSTLDSSVAIAGEDMTVISNVSESLYRNTSTGVELAAAESVNISDDKLTYTFTIRDSKWSDGTPVTAYDFEYGWKRLANPETGGEYSYMLTVAGVKNASDVTYNGGDINSLGVKAVDDKTFVVELDRVVPYLESLLTGTYFAPINKEFAEAQGDQYGLTKDNVLSNGPFVVTDWEVGGEFVVLSKNPYYWDTANIKLDTLNFKTIKDAQSGVIAYESDELDYVGITGDLVSQYKDSPEYQSSVARMLYYFQPNLKVAGFENKNLRLAFALAFDKNSITDNILKNGSLPANFLIPNSLASGVEGKTFRDAANKTYQESNKELALEYFNKAKKELNQDTFSFELLYDDDDTTSQIAQFYQSEIQSTLPGVTITLKPQPKKNRIELEGSGDFELAISRWGADYNDPSTYFDLFTTDGSYNFGKWSNAEYDKLVKSASNELISSPQERLDAYIKSEQIILDDAVIFPIYQMGSAYLLRTNISVEKSVDGNTLWRTADIIE
jgi:oligopeptide transport system substrate-binding protein